ncbi:MAG: hypothetical protein LIO77_08030 [Rikenellaceae bacterium]|nr:hypothetical protein [Rikenellaceae bacterium]
MSKDALPARAPSTVQSVKPLEKLFAGAGVNPMRAVPSELRAKPHRPAISSSSLPL